MKAVFEREFKSYFQNVTGYIFIAFLLLFAGIYTMAINLNNGSPKFEYVLRNMSFIFLIIVPVLTMRVIAEEKRQKTDQLLYALPVSTTKIVLGKYLAMLAVLAIPVAILSLYPVILSRYGNVYLPASFGTLIGFYFLGATLIAMGMFISSVTENQTIAAILTFVMMLVVYFIADLSYFVPRTSSASFIVLTILILLLCVVTGILTKNSLAAVLLFVLCEAGLSAVLAFSPASLAGLVPNIMKQLSVFDRFYTFVDGVFDITALIYYLMVIMVFGFLTVQSLEKRRWS